jgi:hypothetical protein
LTRTEIQPRAKIFVRKTSWDHAVQIVRGDDGVTRAVID